MYNIDLGSYRIRTQDDRNIVLIELGKVRNPRSKNFGAPTERVLGYYGTIDSALQGYVNARLNGKSCEIDSIEEALNMMESIRNEIRLKFSAIGEQNG